MESWFDNVRDEQIRSYAKLLPARAELLRNFDAIHLFATFDIEGLLRRDGQVLVTVLDWENGAPVGTAWRAATDQERSLCFVAASERIPQLLRMLPPRPSGAIDCTICKGQGRIQGILCASCGAVGWNPLPTA
jgi:hypothetical protein